MDWRIKEIRYTNFKFFKDEFPLTLDGKNLLLYGENGSGKSSIAMGLYTLLESRKKTEADVKKYFVDTPENDEHLRNRYSEQAEHSSISITYEKTSDRSLENRCIGDEIVETQNVADLFCQQSLAASDVLSYRTLTDLLYRRNSTKVDLFDIFADEFFLFLDLDEPYKNLQGQFLDPTDLSIASWWKYLNEEIITINNYDLVNKLLVKFETKVNSTLEIIQEFANNCLSDELDHSEIKISLDFSVSHTSLDCLKIKRPELILTAKESNFQRAGWSASIHHLATHFNEARLTCIAIALRMAIAEQRHLSMPDINAFLCVDDLLLSLDMGNRLSVIQMILNREGKWQLLILTHDRALYEEFRRQIPDNEKNTKWVIRELYLKHPSLSDKDYPVPFIKIGRSYRESAEEYYIQRDYATCANHLRKYAEEQLKIFLPKNLQLKIDKDIYKTNDLNGLISMLSTYAKQLCINSSSFPSIEFYRQRLLNPLSHNDLSTPIYMREIEACMKELDKLPLLIDNTFVLVTRNQTGIKKWKISVSKGAMSDCLSFTTMEPWIYLMHSGNRYIQEVQIEVCHNDSGLFPDHAKGSLRDVFTSLCKNIGYFDPATMPTIIDAITYELDGTLLSAYRGEDFRKAVKNNKM